ncbi:hypothetical protein JHW43_009299 [Diplocarpon mali]|nr:hypothetical protein JHW43_009299 [Diplocarpon mali]
MTSSPRLPIVPCSALDLVCATRRRLRSTARLPPISRTRLRTISSDIASHRIASHRIVSHLIASHHTVSTQIYQIYQIYHIYHIYPHPPAHNPVQHPSPRPIVSRRFERRPRK